MLKRDRPNVINNTFIAVDSAYPANGLIFGSDPGSDSEDDGLPGAPPQGTVLTTTDLGDLWVSGNIMPPENTDHYSTVSAANPVPVAARVTTWPASELGVRVVQTVGSA